MSALEKRIEIARNLMDSFAPLVSADISSKEEVENVLTDIPGLESMKRRERELYNSLAKNISLQIENRNQILEKTNGAAIFAAKTGREPSGDIDIEGLFTGVIINFSDPEDERAFYSSIHESLIQDNAMILGFVERDFEINVGAENFVTDIVCVSKENEKDEDLEETKRHEALHLLMRHIYRVLGIASYEDIPEDTFMEEVRDLPLSGELVGRYFHDGENDEDGFISALNKLSYFYEFKLKDEVLVRILTEPNIFEVKQMNRMSMDAYYPSLGDLEIAVSGLDSEQITDEVAKKSIRQSAALVSISTVYKLIEFFRPLNENQEVRDNLRLLIITILGRNNTVEIDDYVRQNLHFDDLLELKKEGFIDEDDLEYVIKTLASGQNDELGKKISDLNKINQILYEKFIEHEVSNLSMDSESDLARMYKLSDHLQKINSNLGKVVFSDGYNQVEDLVELVTNHSSVGDEDDTIAKIQDFNVRLEKEFRDRLTKAA